MSSPTFVGAGAFAVIPVGGSGNVPAPPGLADDDYVLLFMASGNSGTGSTVTVPAGFTLLSEVNSSAFAGGHKIYGRFASSDPANYSVTATVGSNLINAYALAYRGVAVAVTDDLQVNNARPSATSHSFATVTATSAFSTLVGFAAEDQLRTQTLTAAGGMTLRKQENYQGFTSGVVDEYITGTGAVSGRTITSSDTGNYKTVSILLAGAPAPPETDPPVITSVVGTGGTEASSGSFTSDEAGTAYWKLTATSTPESVPTYPDAMTGWTSQAMTAGANSIASLTATPGTYWLQVAAQDDEATPNRVSAPTVSAASFVVSAVSSDTEAPTPPLGLVLTLITKNSFIPVWEASTDDTAVTGYEYRVNGGSVVDAGDVLTVAAGISGLTPGAEYTFEVRAYDAAGNRSTYSSATQTLPLWGFAFSTSTGLDFGAIVGALTAVARETAGASWTVYVHNDSTRALLLTSGTLTIDSAGRLPDYTSATLDSGTYFVSFRRADGAFAAARLSTVDLS